MYRDEQRLKSLLVETIERDLSALKGPQAQQALASQRLLEGYEKALGIVPKLGRGLRDRFQDVTTAAASTVVDALPRPLETQSSAAQRATIGELQEHVDRLTAADGPVQRLMLLLNEARYTPKYEVGSRMPTGEAIALLGTTLTDLRSELLGAVVMATSSGLPEAFQARLKYWEDVRGRVDEHLSRAGIFSDSLKDAQPGTDLGGEIREQLNLCMTEAKRLQEIFEADMTGRMQKNAEQLISGLPEFELEPGDMRRVCLPDEAKSCRQSLWYSPCPGIIDIFRYDITTEEVSIEQIQFRTKGWFNPDGVGKAGLAGIEKVIKEHELIRQSSEQAPRSIQELLKAADEFRLKAGKNKPLGFVGTLYHPEEIRNFALWYLAYCDGPKLGLAPGLSHDVNGEPLARSLDDQATFIRNNTICRYLSENVGGIREKIWESVFLQFRFRQALR